MRLPILVMCFGGKYAVGENLVLVSSLVVFARKEKCRHPGLRAAPYVGTPIPIPGALWDILDI